MHKCKKYIIFLGGGGIRNITFLKVFSTFADYFAILYILFIYFSDFFQLNQKLNHSYLYYEFSSML